MWRPSPPAGSIRRKALGGCWPGGATPRPTPCCNWPRSWPPRSSRRDWRARKARVRRTSPTTPTCPATRSWGTSTAWRTTPAKRRPAPRCGSTATASTRLPLWAIPARARRPLASGWSWRRRGNGSCGAWSSTSGPGGRGWYTRRAWRSMPRATASRRSIPTRSATTRCRRRSGWSRRNTSRRCRTCGAGRRAWGRSRSRTWSKR